MKPLWITVPNPASDMICLNLAGPGKLSTDAGRYSYALLFPEILPPMTGRIFRNYRLYSHRITLL